MTAPAPLAFDSRPLTDPVDRAEARAFAKHLRDSGRVPRLSGATWIGIVGIAVVAVFMLSVFGVLFGSIGSLLTHGVGMFTLIPIVLVLFVLGVLSLLVVGLVRGGGGSIRWFRLDRFARANGMTYLPTRVNTPLPGMIFQQGSGRASSDLVRGDRPRFVEFANYRYTTGSGKNRTTHRWGYVAVRLDVPLPHIVLDAVGNNGLFGASNLPAAFDRDQRLSLEGDFDRYFSLYCPQGYERDALYLFTPDIMARFIDNAAALDVEIVDDWLFLYAKRDLSTLDPATWAWLFSVVAALLDKLAQWGRWRDERLAATAAAEAAAGIPMAASAPLTPPPAGVAAQGRRLKRGVSWVTIVAVAAVVLWWVVNLAFDFVP